MLTTSLKGPANSSSAPLYGSGCVSCGVTRSVAGPRLVGLAGASSGAVQELQNSLVAYAQAFGINMEVNPRLTTGEMTDETALGALYVLWKASDSLPGVSSLKGAIKAIPGLGSIMELTTSNPTARALAWAGLKQASPSTAANLVNFVASNATALSVVVRASTAAKGGLPLPPPGGAPTASLVASGLFVGGNRLNTNYPAGSIQTFSAKRGTWLVAKPLAGLFGLGATHAFAAEVPAAVANVMTVSNQDFDKATDGSPGSSSWYGTTAGKVGIAAGVLALLGGGYYFFVK